MSPDDTNNVTGGGPMNCPNCGGTGKVLRDEFFDATNEGSTFEMENEPCLMCEGTGRVIKESMPTDLTSRRAEA